MSILRKDRIAMGLCLMFTLAALNLAAPAYPPDPENAALLYYQAFLTVPKDEAPVDNELRDYASGKIELNEAVEDYVGSCRGAIGLAVAASELRQCEWGLQYSKGFDMLLGHLGQSRGLARILIADGRIQVSKGNHELGLERCVAALKMSRHVGDETLISFLVGVAVENMAGDCIGDLLGRMPADVKTLEPLKAELARLAKRSLSAVRSLDIEREVAAEQMRMDKIGDLMRSLDAKKSEEEVLAEVRKLGGEAFLNKSRDYYRKHMSSVISILRSGSSYAQTHQQLTELAGKLPKAPDPEKNPEAMFTTAVAPAVSKIYGNMVRGRTQANALRAAVDIYISMAKTGQLPDTLPSGLPKDLFSGKDFEYKKTKAGFILRCRGKDIDKDKVQEYEFTVSK